MDYSNLTCFFLHGRL